MAAWAGGGGKTEGEGWLEGVEGRVDGFGAFGRRWDTRLNEG